MRWDFQADGRVILPSSYIVLDGETSGLDADSELLSIEACKICNGKIQDRFSGIIHPKKPIKPWVIPLIGLTEDAIAKGEDRDTILRDFFDWAGSYPFVLWNPDFLLRFLPLPTERCYNMIELAVGTPYTQGMRTPKISAIWKQCMGKPIDRKRFTQADTLSILLPILTDCRRQI